MPGPGFFVDGAARTFGVCEWIMEGCAGAGGGVDGAARTFGVCERRDSPADAAVACEVDGAARTLGVRELLSGSGVDEVVRTLGVCEPAAVEERCR